MDNASLVLDVAGVGSTVNPGTLVGVIVRMGDGECLSYVTVLAFLPALLANLRYGRHGGDQNRHQQHRLLCSVPSPNCCSLIYLLSLDRRLAHRPFVPIGTGTNYPYTSPFRRYRVIHRPGWKITFLSPLLQSPARLFCLRPTGPVLFSNLWLRRKVV